MKYLVANLGSAADLYYEAERYPELGGFSNAVDLGIFAGGPVLNTACIASSRGAEVKALDHLKAGDATTPVLIGKLDEFGVDTADVICSDDAENAKVMVIKTQGERTYLVFTAKRPPFPAQQRYRDLLNGAGCIYSLIYGINDAFPDHGIINEARKNGARMCFDGSDNYTDPKIVETLLELADGLFINRETYALLENAMGTDPAQELFKRGCGFVCRTDGANGADCLLPDGMIHAPALKIDAVDSTGAGDSFAATFMFGLMKGYDYGRCLRMASAAGAYACTVFGGQGGACSERQLLEFAEERGYVI